MDGYERQHSAYTCGKLLRKPYSLWSLQSKPPHKEYVNLHTLQGKRTNLIPCSRHVWGGKVNTTKLTFPLPLALSIKTFLAYKGAWVGSKVVFLTETAFTNFDE